MEAYTKKLKSRNGVFVYGYRAYSCGEGGIVFVINRNTILLLHMFTDPFHSPSGCQTEKQSQVISEEDGKSVVLSV